MTRINIDEILHHETPRTERESKVLQEFAETIVPQSSPMSSADHQQKARVYSARADELKVGGKKDALQAAADAHSKAADAIDKANLASRKAEAFD